MNLVFMLSGTYGLFICITFNLQAGTYICTDDTKRVIKSVKLEVLGELKIVIVDFITIPPLTNQ